MAKATDLSTAQTRVQPCESASKSPTSNISRAANSVALTGVLIDGELSDVFHGGARTARDRKGGGWSPLGIAGCGTATVVGYLADLMTGRVPSQGCQPAGRHRADLISASPTQNQGKALRLSDRDHQSRQRLMSSDGSGGIA